MNIAVTKEANKIRNNMATVYITGERWPRGKEFIS